MYTRIDKIYGFERKILRIKTEIKILKLVIQRREKKIESLIGGQEEIETLLYANEITKLRIQTHEGSIKSYEGQIKMIKKSIEDNPGKFIFEKEEK